MLISNRSKSAGGYDEDDDEEEEVSRPESMRSCAPLRVCNSARSAYDHFVNQQTTEESSVSPTPSVTPAPKRVPRKRTR